MHELIELGLARETHGPRCISYVLEDDSLFNLSEYKIVRNQETKKFLDSAKSRYNGKLKLTYFIEDCVSLKSLTPTIESYTFVSVVANLLGSVLEVMKNGYLEVTDLVLDMNRIFVDPNSMEVKLIYLPINMPANRGTTTLRFSPMEDIRSNLVKLIFSTPNILSSRTKELCDWLSDSSKTIEDIYANLRIVRPVHGTSISTTQNVTMTLTAINTPERIEFRINKPVFSIGRNAGENDGHIGFNPAISGMHCKIYKTQAGFEVEDCSRNGTFVNKTKIQSGKRAKLKNGDILRLANSDFSVSITEG